MEGDEIVECCLPSAQGCGANPRLFSKVAAAAIVKRLEHGQLTIVVPVFNAAEETRRCLESLVANTGLRHRVLVIDDHSTQPAVNRILKEYGQRPEYRVLRNAANLGFVATANRGMAEAEGDVVLLNSDTEMPPRWLPRLVVAAYHRPDVGSVTPFSNAAGAFSAPELGVNAPLPTGLSLLDITRLVERCSRRVWSEVPTGNGFCMYLKRDMLDEVGLFDQERFHRGYGEENDLCMRALRKGWKHVIDDASFVYHKREASFGSEKFQLIERNQKIIEQLYPEYQQLVKERFNAPKLKEARQRIKQDMQEAVEQGRPQPRRILRIYLECPIERIPAELLLSVLVSSCAEAFEPGSSGDFGPIERLCSLLEVTWLG